MDNRKYNMLQQNIQIELEKCLQKHPDVAGVSIGLVNNYITSGISAGYARKATQEMMTPSHYMECASLSKTVASAFAIEYFKKRDISMSSKVSDVLISCGSPWRLEVHPDQKHRSDINLDNITVSMLMNHTALGMHYVYGIPLSDTFPNSLELLNGTWEEKYGYAPLYIERPPGSSFKYSGGGYIVLQHILECFEKKSIHDIIYPFLESCGMYEFSFALDTDPTHSYAYGQIDALREVQPTDGGRLSFPPLAAGGLCTSQCLVKFLTHLSLAYDRLEGSGGISHDTAVTMLGSASLLDLGCVDFMRSKMGIGVFVAVAGPNKIMLHQAANDGFRGVYMVCFDGPDKGKGFVILVNGDNPAVYFQSEICRYLLSPDCLNIEGINFNKWYGDDAVSFNMEGLKQEQIVNLGLKELVLSAFINEYNENNISKSAYKSTSSTNSRL